MIKGTVEAVSVKPFVTKAGASMFKIGIKIEGLWYNSVSKFEEQKFKKGTDVFFEVQEQWPDSIVMGTLKITNGVTATTILQGGHKDASTNPSYNEVKKLRAENAELKRKLKELEDDAVMKELDNQFDDDIPF